MNSEMFLLAEQDGQVEQQFKKLLIEMFAESGKRLRAYLGLVRYGSSSDLNVALMMRYEEGEDEFILKQCNNIFRDMFSNTQHLDMMFISEDMEQKLRKICCPFYTSKNFNVTTPDFYLYSNDGYHLDDVIRNCYMRARFPAGDPEGYMLCDIDPPLKGEFYGLKDKDINQLFIGCKSQGMTLFPVSSWPLPIYVFRSLIDNIVPQEIIDSSNSELIAWAEIYNCKEDIRVIST